MSVYRITIPYGSPMGAAQGRILRFTAELDCEGAAEARSRGFVIFQELIRSTGFTCLHQPTENDLFIEAFDPRGAAPLEMASLELLPGVYCMSLAGPLDGATVLHLEREVHRLQHAGAKSLAIDFAGVHPLSSAGLGVLLTIHDCMDLQLVRVPPTSRAILRTLGLDATLVFYSSFPEALKRWKEGSSPPLSN